MHITKTEKLLRGGPVVVLTWNATCTPVLSYRRTKPHPGSGLSVEIIDSLRDEMLARAPQVGFKVWPRPKDVLTVEFNEQLKLFSVEVFGHIRVTIPDHVFSRVWNSGIEEDWQRDGFLYRTYREQSRHGGVWLKTELKTRVGSPQGEPFYYRASCSGRGRTLVHAFDSVMDSSAQEVGFDQKR